MSKSSISDPNAVPQLCSCSETAKLLGVSLSWLAKSRMRGDGPRYRKIGRSVRYVLADLHEYLKARCRNSTSEY